MKEAPSKKSRFGLSDVNKEVLATLYHEQRLTLDDIGRMFGVTRQAVYKALKGYGIARRERSDASVLAFSKGRYKGKTTGEFNESLFSKWSQSMAYLLGYIFTDGSLHRVSKTNFNVIISSVDRDHLEKLATILGKGIKILTQKQGKKGFSGSGDRYIHLIQCSRPRMIKDLRKLELTQRKSLTMKFPPVPDEFLRDFIRGCWDGDGSIFIQRNGNLRAQFGTGSLAFIQAMHDRLSNRGFGRMTIHTKEPGSGGRKNPHYYLNIISKHAVAFCEWIYDNVPTELMLLRKALVYEYWKRSQRQRDFSELAGEKNSFAGARRLEYNYCK